jgi:acyl carrier protein
MGVVNADLHQQVVGIFADVFQLDLGPSLANVVRGDVRTWDSVNHLRLVMELEQTFGITLSDDDVLGMASLRDAEAALARHGVGAPASDA